MRQFALFILFALSFAAPIAAQDAIDLTIYRDADSFTIFAPSAPYGLALQVTLPDGRTLTQSLVAYPAFRGAQSNSPSCFRLEREGSDSPVPQDCQNAQIFIQSLIDGDVFWYDSTLNQDLTVMIVRDGQIYGVCAAGIPRCTTTFIPSLGEVALCDGAADLENHEVLVIVAKFDKLSESPLNPDREWEDAIQNAIDQLEGQVNARVLRVPQVITTQDEALQLSDCYNATLVVWGKLAAARVESNYTAKARWSKINEQPGQTVFEANRALSQSILDQLTFFVSLDGGDTEYVLNFILGQLYYFGEDSEDALPLFEQAIALIPASREREMNAAAIDYYIGYIHHAIEGNLSKALLAYSDAIEIEPDSQRAADAYNSRGAAYYAQNSYSLAIADYTQAIALNPNYYLPYNNRGNVYFKQGEYDLAIADYIQAITLNPNYALAYINRGNVYYKQGEYDLAITDYIQAITLNPNDADAFNNLGNVYYKQGEYDLAIADYTQAIALNPDYVEVFNNRGLAYYIQGEYDLAIADYDRAIALNASYVDAYYNRGVVYEVQGEYAHAVSDYSQTIAVNPNHANAFWGLGNSYNALERYDDALTAYRRYIELAGENANPSIIARVRELESATPTPAS